MSDYKQILNNLVLISIDCTIWSAKKKLRPEDLGDANLPPEKLASLGSKRVFDPEAIKGFHTLKRKAERLCEAAGTRFLGCYAVPKEKASAVLEGIEVVKQEFETAKNEFLADYDKVLNSWLEEAGEWRNAIANAVESVTTVSSRLNFRTAAYMVGVPEDVEVAEPLMKEQVGGIAGQLIYEIGQEAKASWEESYRGKSEVTRRAVRPLKGILEKLRGLLFVNPDQFSDLVTNIEAALDAIPKKGPVTGAALMGLVGVLHECADLAGFVTAREKAEMLPEPEPEEAILDNDESTEEQEDHEEINCSPQSVAPADVWFW